jgi:hypothetical protein
VVVAVTVVRVVVAVVIEVVVLGGGLAGLPRLVGVYC